MLIQNNAPPARVLQDETTEARTHDGADWQDATDQTDRLRASRRIPFGDNANRRRQQTSAANGLERAKRDEDADIWSQTAQQRRDGENSDARQEHAPAAERVAEFARDRIHDHLHDLVDGQSPAKEHQRGVQGGSQLGQRDGHDGGVDRAHQGGRRDQSKQDAAAWIELTFSEHSGWDRVRRVRHCQTG
jgi:hypothetical protein